MSKYHKIKFIQLTGTETYEGQIKTHSSNITCSEVVSDYTALFIVLFSTQEFLYMGSKKKCKTKFDSVAARLTNIYTMEWHIKKHFKSMCSLKGSLKGTIDF